MNKQFDERTILRFERLAEAVDKYNDENNKELDRVDSLHLVDLLQKNILSDKQIFEIACKLSKKKIKRNV